VAFARVLVGLVWVLSGVASADQVVNGVTLPDGAEKVGENRYRVREDYAGAEKFFKTAYPPGQYPRRSIVQQPGVKAFHIANPTGKKWEGLNIYQASDGEVRVFVIVAPVAPAKKADKPAGTTGKK
jgi:hypothetical protein